jgi:hypothetical protein
MNTKYQQRRFLGRFWMVLLISVPHQWFLKYEVHPVLIHQHSPFIHSPTEPPIITTSQDRGTRSTSLETQMQTNSSIFFRIKLTTVPQICMKIWPCCWQKLTLGNKQFQNVIAWYIPTLGSSMCPFLHCLLQHLPFFPSVTYWLFCLTDCAFLSHWPFQFKMWPDDCFMILAMV